MHDATMVPAPKAEAEVKGKAGTSSGGLELQAGVLLSKKLALLIKDIRIHERFILVDLGFAILGSVYLQTQTEKGGGDSELDPWMLAVAELERELRELLSRGPPRPAILGGDFNTALPATCCEPHVGPRVHPAPSCSHPPWRRRKLVQLALEFGLCFTNTLKPESAMDDLAPPDMPRWMSPTWTFKGSAPGSCPAAAPKSQIDYIRAPLGSPAADVVSPPPGRSGRITGSSWPRSPCRLLSARGLFTDLIKDGLQPMICRLRTCIINCRA